MKQAFGLKMGASLTVTPALQQAIRLLQLSSLDLQQEIQQALDSNVMLEIDDEGEAEALEVTAETDPERAERLEMAEVAELGSDLSIPEDMPVDAEWGDIYDVGSTSSGTHTDDDESAFEYRLNQNSQHVSLQAHLLEQLRLSPLSGRDLELGYYLIDAINDDGYLEDWEDLCTNLNQRLGQDLRPAMTAVLQVIQDFDPAGVAARDLGECLRLQLQNQPDSPTRSLALTITEAPYLPLLSHRDPQVQAATLAKGLGLKADSLQPAIALLKSLQPYPGRPFQNVDDQYIVPDVIVTRHKNRWRVALNGENCPRVRINPHYLSMVKRADSSRDQQTLKNHLQEARYFLNSLESRNETLLKVAQCIIEEQRSFLEYGPEAMRPLVLRDVADQLGVHESTVSRATANKYLMTPRGLFELKYFFSSHVQTSNGGVASATAIQAMIERLIAAEGSKPLSDSQLADLLQAQGIQVARRTVAKYREALGINASHERVR
jgi:RNA polymerase sigma-54 factor